MGTMCSSVQTDYRVYKKNPRLVEEFRCGNSFLRNLFRLEFQFYGDFEEVWKIQDKSNSAIYSLHERKKLNLIENKTCYNFINRENRIITDLSNQFIQKVHFTFHEETSLYIVTEYIHGRLSFCVKQQFEFTEPQLQYIAASLVLGLEYLMSKGIIHRDLRPENIFFNQYGKVKISGFLYCKKKENVTNTPFDCVGTVGYMAPEVIEKKPHSRLVDLYGLGIVMYELATSAKLFSGTDNEANLKKMKRLKISHKDLLLRYSQNLADLLTLLLKFNENERIGACTFDEVKSHPWFANFNWDSLETGKMEPMFVPQREERELLERVNKKIDYKLLRRPSMQNLFVGFQYGLETKSSIDAKDMSEGLI